jgi:hypothetical protein
MLTVHRRQLCDSWNTLKSSGARVTYNGTAPRCDLTATPDASASMALQYDAVTVYYFNTSSNAEQALYRFPINDSDYTRSRVRPYSSPIFARVRSCACACGRAVMRVRSWVDVCHEKQGNMTKDQFCINYERVLDNGAGLLLQQCLFDAEQSVLFGNQTLIVPPDFTKAHTAHAPPHTPHTPHAAHTARG